MSDTMIPEKVLDRVRKLLAMANDKRGNENEASNAASMAQQIISEYGLELAQLESVQDGPAGGKRAKTTHDRAAMYAYQRTLMAAVAANNFCRHFVIEVQAESFGKMRKVKRHVLLGRTINVTGATMVYDYLVDTMDRLLPWQGMEKRGKDALLWLDGCATRLAERLDNRRAEMEAASEARRREEEMRAKHPGAAPTANALVLADAFSSEEDFNNDFLREWEPGTTARKKREQAAASKARSDQLEAAMDDLIRKGMSRSDAWYVARGMSTPSEQEVVVQGDTRTEKKKAKDEARDKRWSDQYRARHERERAKTEARISHPAYRSGARTGEEIGLDQQVNVDTKRRIA